MQGRPEKKDSERKVAEHFSTKERSDVKAARILKHRDVAGTTTACKNENTNTETLNGFKVGVSRLSLLSRKGLLLRGRTGSVELTRSFHGMCCKVFSFVTTQRHVWSARVSVKNLTLALQKVCVARVLNCVGAVQRFAHKQNCSDSRSLKKAGSSLQSPVFIFASRTPVEKSLIFMYF